MDRKFVRMIKISNINLNSENQYLDISKKREKEKKKEGIFVPENCVSPDPNTQIQW